MQYKKCKELLKSVILREKTEVTVTHDFISNLILRHKNENLMQTF